MTGSTDLNLGALAAWLAPRLPGLGTPMAVRRFDGGRSNPTFELTTDVRRVVMRCKPGPAAGLLPSAHAIEREFRVQRSLAGSAVPVARPLLFCDDEGVVGRAFYLMEHVEGRIFWDPSLPGLTPAERAAIYEEINRVIAALHDIDPAAAGLADYGRAGNYVERQIARWTRQYQATTPAPIDEMERLLHWLPRHLPDSARGDRRVSVVHGDFRIDNLLLHPEEPRVLAVLDWELSTLGHPWADFANHLLAWRIPPSVFRGMGGLDHAALGIPTEAEYLRRYCERSRHGAGAELLADAGYYRAYNLFRLAAIAQGVAHRNAKEPTLAQRDAQVARELAAMAWQAAENGP